MLYIHTANLKLDKNTRNHIIVAAVITSYYKVTHLHTWELYKLRKIPTWKIPNGNNFLKSAYRGPQHFLSHQFLNMNAGEGTEEATLGGADQTEAGGDRERSCWIFSLAVIPGATGPGVWQ